MYEKLIEYLRGHKEITFIFVALFLIVISVVLTELFNKSYISPLKPKTPRTTNEIKSVTPVPTTIIISPSSIFPTTSQHSDYTGADSEANKKYLESNPDLLVEERLKGQVPLVLDGFTLDYSYANDNFVIHIKDPYAENLKKYNDWFVKIGLKDRSHFEVVKKIP